MSDNIEFAKDGIEKAHEAHLEHGDGSARRIAILISALAAALALAEMGEKSAQNAYLTHHISLSDNYAFFQARTVRANVFGAEVDVLESLPGASDPAVKKKVDAARSEAARMESDPKNLGRKELRAQAEIIKADRERAFHRYEELELVVGALQIAIVLASVSVVTRIRAMSLGAAAIGGVAAVYGVLVVAGVA